MLFNSLEFIVFFPIIVALYMAIPHRFRWVLLLLASYYFYMCWSHKFVVLIFTTTLINYLAGMGIGTTNNPLKKKIYLVVGVGSSLSILFFFKYFNFFGESINIIFERFNIFHSIPYYNLILPVGISFYTFQTLSYTLDVYYGREKVEYHFGMFALFVSFFPQLVAGPIERSTNLLHQFRRKYTFNYTDVRMGIAYMVWGYFKKVVIADRLSEYVNIVFNNPEMYGGWHNLIATVFFTVQIYCDFSGYSDIAIGTARIMGIRLMVNFHRPYFALNIKEFWQRWHISLSTWFKDYFYIPLGGNRVVKWRMHYNLMATFIVSGLWHGANWTFVVWGGLHGFYLVFAILTKNLREKIKIRFGLTNKPSFYRQIQIFTTLLLVVFAWIFFRANSIDDALLFIKNCFIFDNSMPINLYRIPSDFYLALSSIVVLFFLESWEERTTVSDRLIVASRWIKVFVLLLFVAAIFILGVWDGIDFLYFQF